MVDLLEMALFHWVNNAVGPYPAGRWGPLPPSKPNRATCATERIIICVILLGILSTMPASAGSPNWCGTRSGIAILVT